MCGITALQIRDPELREDLGELLHGMLCQVVDRGPDSAGISVYDDDRLTRGGQATVSILDTPLDDQHLSDRLRDALPQDADVTVRTVRETTVINAAVEVGELVAAVRSVAPQAQQIGRGTHVVTLKGVGNPVALADAFGLRQVVGSQGVTHTRMATESAVTASGSHPFAVDDDLCLVHNGSFSNHASIRRRLRAKGVSFDSDNDSEVAARFLAWRLREGDDLETALASLQEQFDGFYTLVITTKDRMAVVRDPIACKPAVVAETDRWVAMASEYRALAGLPGVEEARLFEPEPGRVYTWTC